MSARLGVRTHMCFRFGGPFDSDMQAALRNGHAVRTACELRAADIGDLSSGHPN